MTTADYVLIIGTTASIVSLAIGVYYNTKTINILGERIDQLQAHRRLHGDD